ncbi:MAG: F0F1 ATP synthase subunit B' [Rhodospirillaceae bacterium]|nr:MAG: F0F1 ATP synthase subunit B' [Rhodospirillaceae bacterium]
MRILNKKTALGLSALVSGALVSSPAFAKGLPQLNVDTFAPQVVWLVITFVVLYLLMSNVALPRIGDVLEERQNKIDDNLAKAQELKAQGEAACATYEKSLSDARTNAQAAIREVKDSAAAEAATRQSALNKKLQAQISSSEQAITKARDEALLGIKDIATDVASSVVEKLIGDAPQTKTLNGAVKASLKEQA